MIPLITHDSSPGASKVYTSFRIIFANHQVIDFPKTRLLRMPRVDPNSDPPGKYPPSTVQLFPTHNGTHLISVANEAQLRNNT